MNNQLRRLSRGISAVAVMALVITVTAPDVMAQTRGQAKDQEARTSGRSATVDQSTSRKSTASRAPQTNPKRAATTRASESTTSRTGTSGNRAVSRKRIDPIQKVQPPTVQDRGNDKGRGSRTTTRNSDGTRGNRDRARDSQKDRSGKGTVTTDRRDRRDRGVNSDRDRRDRVRADRTSGSRRSTIAGKRAKYRPVVTRPNRYYKYNRHYNRYVHTSSHLFLGLTWPWQDRYYRHWAPSYRYRQVVYVNVGWGSNRRAARVDVSTSYSQRIVAANDEFAEIEITIENIDLHQDGIFLGNVDRIPNRVAKVIATVWADGTIEFDKNVFVVGDRQRGFEIIATRQYDDYLLNAYRRDHRIEVAKVDLRRGRAKMTRRSRLFDPYNFKGNVPMSLLPDDDRLWDYGSSALSGRDDYGYRNRDLSIQYRTDNGLDVELQGETYLERIN